MTSLPGGLLATLRSCDQTKSDWHSGFCDYFGSEDFKMGVAKDDLIFFVRSNRNDEEKTVTEVYRHGSERVSECLKLKDRYDWRRSFHLNVVLHQFDYVAVCAVCQRLSSTNLQMISKLSQGMSSFPHKTQEDQNTIYDSPVHFICHDPDSLTGSVRLCRGQVLAVELVGLRDDNIYTFFLGSINHDKVIYALQRITHDNRRNSLYYPGREPASSCQIVRMKGPHGRGSAELSVWTRSSERRRPSIQDIVGRFTDLRTFLSQTNQANQDEIICKIISITLPTECLVKDYILTNDGNTKSALYTNPGDMVLQTSDTGTHTLN
ncbi:hypothetical protein ACOME3_006703 [Neoechinorhynchus agilis]